VNPHFQPFRFQPVHTVVGRKQPADRILQLANLVVTLALHGQAVVQVQIVQLLERFATTDEGEDGARVASERHVRLSETVVGECEQAVFAMAR
jgi:hypothetical protein